MIYTFYILSHLLILFSLIPLIQNQFWFFRIFDFAKVQILILQIILVIYGAFFIPISILYIITISFLAGCIVWEIILLYPYTPFYKVPSRLKNETSSIPITIISANVYQFNKEFHKFIKLINEVNPDIFATMESNLKWDNALHPLEAKYPYYVKVPLENTYGIHLYSKIEFIESKTHFFVSDDIPSIEATFKTKDGYTFTLFIVHPPPPSPTEESTSKERDGELLAIAKHIRQKNYKSCVVIGDFNNVAWGKSSVLFRKTSEMIDPRIGRGIISTYHAKWKLLRFPIDQMFHSIEIFVLKIKTLPQFGSDHLPLFCEFIVDYKNDKQKLELEKLKCDELKTVDKMIKDGINEDGDRDKIVTE